MRSRAQSAATWFEGLYVWVYGSLRETSATFFKNLAAAERSGYARRLLGLDTFLLSPLLLTPCILLGYEIVSCICNYELTRGLDLRYYPRSMSATWNTRIGCAVSIDINVKMLEIICLFFSFFVFCYWSSKGSVTMRFFEFTRKNIWNRSLPRWAGARSLLTINWTICFIRVWSQWKMFPICRPHK